MRCIIIYAVILAFLVHRLELVTALLVGGLFGLALYLVNFYGFTAIFPWFAEARNWVSIVSPIVFGLLAAWAYKTMAHPQVARIYPERTQAEEPVRR
jgi:hypothetical protein